MGEPNATNKLQSMTVATNLNEFVAEMESGMIVADSVDLKKVKEKVLAYQKQYP